VTGSRLKGREALFGNLWLLRGVSLTFQLNPWRSAFNDVASGRALKLSTKRCFAFCMVAIFKLNCRNDWLSGIANIFIKLLQCAVCPMQRCMWNQMELEKNN